MMHINIWVLRRCLFAGRNEVVYIKSYYVPRCWGEQSGPDITARYTSTHVNFSDSSVYIIYTWLMYCICVSIYVQRKDYLS